MATDDKPRSPTKDAGWLAFFLLVLGVLWFAQGGPSKLSSTTGPFIKAPEISESQPPPNQKPSFWEYQESGKPAAPSPSLESPYKGQVYLSARSAAYETDPQKEYLEIWTSGNAEPILITGWTLVGRQNFELAIGKAAYSVYSSQVNPQSDIYLEPGGRAVIVTGSSPMGTSFRLNMCTGYFNQFQTFTPYLPEECPRLSEKDVPMSFPDACVDFVRSLGTCRMPMVSVPAVAGNDCAIFVGEKANYNGCVTAHKNDPNFYKKEWRIYLGREKELWQKRDIIILKDQNKKIIDQVSY